MGKKLWLVLVCLFMMTSMAFAQKQITGTVTEAETGEPLIGAAVRVPGTGNGVLTDANGKFTLKVPAGVKQLQFSYMGMRTVNATPRNGMAVALESDARVMDDVMVVAYGSATKASFTGSAKVVGAENIESLQSTNALDALTGHVAGVELFNPSGDPTNNSPSIRIRGISSITAGTYPLIVVDGAPFPGDMNTINTSDVESMTILKDAAATSLYGARAANGVIIITTKKGKAGHGAKVNFDAKWGSNSRAQREYKTINNPAQYYETYYQSLYNYGVNAQGLDAAAANVWANNNLTTAGDYGLGMNVFDVPAGQLMIGQNGKMNPNAKLGRLVNYGGEDYYLTPDNWLDAAYSNSLRQEYNINVSNATDKSNFYASFGYTNNKGITYNSGMENFNGRLKADLQAKDWLKVGANLSYSHYSAQSMLEDGASNSSANIFASATQIAPIYPLYIRDGQGRIRVDANGLLMYDWADGRNAGMSRPFMSGSNAIQSQQIDLNQWEGNSATANGFVEIRFAKDFKFTSNNTMNLDESRSTSLTNPYYGNYATSNGIIAKGHARTWNYDFIQQLNWAHQFGKHDVEVMAAHDYYRSQSYGLSASRSNMFDPTNLELAGAITDGSNSGSSTGDYNNEGYRFRAQYNYAQKYFLSASYSREASSRFAKDHRWGNFYSAGASWVVSEEKFMKNVKWVDFLKYKISYGEIGNDNIPSFLYTNRYTLVNSNGNAAVKPSTTKKNENITWETVGEMNTGVEFSLFKDRLTGGVEYFWRKTSDMLYFFSLPISTGYTGYYDNIGDMVNHGVEVELNAEIIRMKNFKWNVGLNLTHYKNKISMIPDERKNSLVYDFNGKSYEGYYSGNMFHAEGLSLGTYYMPVYAGVYTQDTWTMTHDAAYDPSKAGSSMWWRSVALMEADGTTPKVDEKGRQLYSSEKYATTTYSDATDYIVSENVLPKLHGGFNTTIQLYDFDFTADFAYQLGGKVYDSDYASFMSSPVSNTKGQNYHADILNAWTPQNQNTDIPRLQFGDQYSNGQSTRFLTKANYLSLQNLTFGYTLPATLTRKAKIDRVRVYLNATNVWLWSARQGLDPRTAATSLSYGSSNASYYSPIRTISAGVSVTF